MSLKELIKRNKESASLLTIAAVLPFMVTSVIISFIIRFEDQMMTFGTQEWILFYIAASLCMALAFTHTTFIALLSGFLLGGHSVIYVISSYLIASALGYLLARKLDKGKLMQSLIEMPKAKVIADELKNNELKIIILSRLSPVLPFAMMNLVLSLLKADFKKYLVGGFVGMLPRTLLFIWAGSQARNLIEAFRKGSENELISIAVVLMLVLSLIGLFYYILRAIQKARRMSK